ncbi:hypothetical protein [Novacetimonas pomaceti]|uniref:Autotransporter outer membrane beta-barrel domain-containing protein n=1 Tax=Novacetimonas pomaceti TaxID=2021998 RepID=A0ABX5NXR4_9PROT|nr:hypothetical protein [Novacetimonas pomaceti]PYD46322.1 hypothetical protein C3920_15985 [Novacetimonas pomaceti]
MSITNSGTIESTAGGQAIDLNDIVGPDNTSTITNNAGGLIKADDADGIRPGANATVVNAGTIYSDGAVGDSHDGIDFQEAPTGTVINEAGGLISGERHGITTDGYVDVYNPAGATIIGRNGSGVGSDGTGKVVNYGTIIGGYNGSGTGDGDGVDIDNYATVINYGTIKAEGAAGVDKNGQTNESEGLALTGGGSVINEKGALITSVQVGVTAGVSAVPMSVYNYGTIHGDEIGVRTSGNSTFYNYGSITSLGKAFESDILNVSNISLYNYGQIVGSADALYFAPTTNNFIYMSSGSVLSGNIENYGTTNFNVSSAYTLGNLITGNGELIKSGQGDLTLIFDNGPYFTGDTDVQAGTLTVDGSLASSKVTVQSGGMLDGRSTVGSVVVENNASLQGGHDGTGTLTVDGNLQQQAGSTLVANGGLVSVTGQADIASGARLMIAQDTLNNFASVAKAGEYRVLSAAGGVNGTYALANTVQISAFDTLIDAYDTNDVYLRAQQDRAFTPVALTRNQIATAGALDALGGAGISSLVGLAGSDAQARRAFDATSGEIHASARTAL